MSGTEAREQVDELAALLQDVTFHWRGHTSACNFSYDELLDALIDLPMEDRHESDGVRTCQGGCRKAEADELADALRTWIVRREDVSRLIDQVAREVHASNADTEHQHEFALGWHQALDGVRRLLDKEMSG